MRAVSPPFFCNFASYISSGHNYEGFSQDIPMQPPAPTAAERDSVCDADVKKKKKKKYVVGKANRFIALLACPADNIHCL